MKLFVVFVALVTSSVAYDEWESLDVEQLENLMLNDTLAPETRGLILNSQAKKCVKNILKQMPCGWPEYDIPAVAPYTNAHLQLQISNSIVQSLLQFFKLRCDGLNQMQIKYLKVSYTFKKTVKFHFNFNEIKVTAYNLESNTLINLQKLGLEIHYVGKGPFEFSLINFSIQGSFKYKAGIIGSSKISKFKVAVNVESVTSKIGGILGNAKINAFLNKEIEIVIPQFLSQYQKELGSSIEEYLVPKINGKLKGKKFWHLLKLLGSSKHKCVPTPAPWLLERV